MVFRDVLYGEVTFPEWLSPFLRLPEFVRLRGVRLSNVDSLQYKDFGNATRYDHAIGVVHLAMRVAKLQRLSLPDTFCLLLASLLHDVGTPPFGHTLEIIFDDVDHELEAWNALGLSTGNHSTGFNAYDGDLPQFVQRCTLVSKSLGIIIQPSVVGSLINGEGDLGYLVKGTIDLDNIDNVLRGAHYMGLTGSKTVSVGKLAESLADWLGTLDGPPSLEGDLPEIALRWIEVRDNYYKCFYDCCDEEQGRQALLQFMIREAFRLGLPKESMLRTTDEGLIRTVSEYARQQGRRADILSDAIHKYKRLDPIFKVAEVHFEDKETLNAFRVKASVGWIENELRQPGFVPALFFSKRRFPAWMKPKESLFDYPDGKLSIFSLYPPKREQSIPTNSSHIADAGELHKKVAVYAYNKPWREITGRTKQDLRESLNSWGNWGFLSSRNESLHTYPSTFVQPIPAAFIKSLRLAGSTILDPFCGSGVTGVVGVQAGCHVICADVNEIALLISRVSTTYLTEQSRTQLRKLHRTQFEDVTPVTPPRLDNLEKWHHLKTIEQLTRIKGLVNSFVSAQEHEFLKLCLSSILTATTARRGKEHSWFADNTPLSKGEKEPPFVDAYDLFLAKIQRNLKLLENYYSVFERAGENPEDALSKSTVVRANATVAVREQQSFTPNSVDAIITSPPYLCMSDYSLGQRLSYAWLFPGCMERDFDEEVGARRRRTNPAKAILEYIESMEKFADYCKQSVRSGGFVALVIGAPEAKDFKDINIVETTDAMFMRNGFELFWERWRPINWRRNPGPERSKSEKLTVFVKK